MSAKGHAEELLGQTLESLCASLATATAERDSARIGREGFARANETMNAHCAALQLELAEAKAALEQYRELLKQSHEQTASALALGNHALEASRAETAAARSDANDFHALAESFEMRIATLIVERADDVSVRREQCELLAAATARIADLKMALGDEAGWFDRYKAATARIAELETQNDRIIDEADHHGAGHAKEYDRAESAETALRELRERVEKAIGHLEPIKFYGSAAEGLNHARVVGALEALR